METWDTQLICSAMKNARAFVALKVTISLMRICAGTYAHSLRMTVSLEVHH